MERMQDEKSGRDRVELTRRIFQTLARGDVSIEEGHGAIVRAMLESLHRMLNEAAAVGHVADVQPWLALQLEQLQFFVAAWQPGASPAIAAQEALEARPGGTVN
jgi:hypothetical protein